MKKRRVFLSTLKGIYVGINVMTVEKTRMELGEHRSS